MSSWVVDIFEIRPWLTPMDQWHPGAAPLVEEARGLATLDPDDASFGLEIWATLGSMTQADVLERIRATSRLAEDLQDEGSLEGWPVVARCLVRLSSSELPGCYLAAAQLLEMMSDARKRGTHRELLSVEWLERQLGLWNDPIRHVYRSAIRTRSTHEARERNYAEAWFTDEYWDLAQASERALSGVPMSGDDHFFLFLDMSFAGR